MLSQSMVVPDLFADGLGVALIANDGNLSAQGRQQPWQQPWRQPGQQQWQPQWQPQGQQQWQRPWQQQCPQPWPPVHLGVVQQRGPDPHVLRWAIDQQQYQNAYSPVATFKQEDGQNSFIAKNSYTVAGADAEADADGESDDVDLVDDGHGGPSNSEATILPLVKKEDGN